ncbi:MAG: FtsW/RodA/SpoVE family cell cycle protein [Microthrixaceae bacterium]
MLHARARAGSRNFRAQDLSSPWRHVDVVLAVTTGLIILFGVVMVFSATRRFDGGLSIVARQGLFILVGIVAMAGVSLVDYRRIADWWQLIYGASLVLLGGVLTPLGSLGAFGTKGWYAFGPIVFQPVELAKLATIVAVAAYLGSADRVDVRRLAVALVLIGLPMGLTLLQPDLGSSLVFIVVGLGMLVVGGVRLRHLAVLVLVGLVGVFGILSSDALDQYQKDRLIAFANPSGVSEQAIYNVKQAQTAISSGGLTGYGFGNGPSTRLGYVPAQQTDFIFTVAGEEFGFVGAGALLVLYSVMIWRIWRIAQLAADPMGTLLCIGVMSMLLFHIFENVGMNLGIMPITGIPLPFVSQGGSAVVAACIALGLVQSVHMHRYA